jgi:dCMP deaminase
MEMVRTLEKRTTCTRRGVGCILVDKDNIVLATGYNGVAKGEPHCNQEVIGFSGTKYTLYTCAGSEAESGQNLHECKAIHAEQNALLQCSDVRRIRTAYVSCTPCIHCIKLLMNTGCEIIMAHEVYDVKAMELWIKSGSRRYEILDRSRYE